MTFPLSSLVPDFLLSILPSPDLIVINLACCLPFYQSSFQYLLRVDYTKSLASQKVYDGIDRLGLRFETSTA